MKKAIRIILSAALAGLFCFSLASCNKGTCDGCKKENVDRTKVTIKVGDESKDVYYCDDCKAFLAAVEAKAKAYDDFIKG